MKDLIYRNLRAENNLRRAMLQQAQGLPAEGVIRYRLIRLGNFLKKNIGRVVVFFWLFSIFGFRVAGLLAQHDLVITLISVVFTGALILFFGNSLLLPPNGQALATTPIRSRRVLLVALSKLLFFLLFGATVMWLAARIGGRSHSILSSILGGMTIPALGVCYQIYRRGVAGAFLLRFGLFSGVVLFFLWMGARTPWVPDWPRMLEPYHQFLPLNWCKNGVGWIAAGAVYLFLAISLKKLWADYSFRDVPGAQVMQNLVENDEDDYLKQPVVRSEVNETSVSFQVRAPAPSYSALASLFWSKEEKELGRYLNQQRRSWDVWKIMILLGLILAMALSWPMGSPQAKEAMRLFYSPALAIIFFLLIVRGVASKVFEMGFTRLALPNGYSQSVMSAFPIRERTLFTMFLKEGVAYALVTFVMQICVFYLLLWIMGLELELLQIAVVLFFAFEVHLLLRLAAWTRQLWESMAFFQPGFRGGLLEHLAKLLFVLPPLTFMITGVVNLALWLNSDDTLSIVSLFFFLQAAWIVGFWWLVRHRYNQGYGTALVRPVKKKSFRFS